MIIILWCRNCAHGTKHFHYLAPGKYQGMAQCLACERFRNPYRD